VADIAILELMDRGHVSLVEAVIKVFTSNPENKLDVYIRKAGFSQISHLQGIPKVSFILVGDNESVSAILKRISANTYHELFITTLDKYIREFSEWDMPANTNLVIHNIDLWFHISFPAVLRRFFLNFGHYNLKYNIKQNLIYPRYYKTIVNKIIGSKGKLVVLNTKLRHVLSSFVAQEHVQVIPFQVFDQQILSGREEVIAEDRRIRICIPGEVSQTRRDYAALFNCFLNDQELMDGFALDLLGSLPETDPANLRSQIEQLQQRGMAVYTYGPQRIPMSLYDTNALKADIIMGNMHVKLMGSAVYGKTKDTGAIYNMIKYACPGLLPAHYDLIDELKSSTWIYEDYQSLGSLLKTIMFDKQKRSEMKKHALKNAAYFTPSEVYNRFIN
jgi:hypothetical protein